MVNYSSTRLDRVFGALADPTRRAMVSRLAKGDTTVTALAAPFRMSLPAVSKHLKVLERAGLVRRRVAGRVHHCALVADPLDQATTWIRDHRRFWAERLAALDALLTIHPPEAPASEGGHRARH
jgi:DNA-binding transcriptional ArsR family regulator